ncbi:hypothetical protein JNB71_13645 [Rhizobium herbae]|uniref:Uncharacterized protein n=1 Tax=Rhizobium herbae TaxID=508661 RepID=A0ABS7HCF0_9HYPH|nr:hypothetical protein [Rhizobium herbae]MBW9064366.1 hypothetical protein [Rhizobium herbae]
MKKKMVEATVKVGGKRVALGIMNTEQALDMPAEKGMKFSHPGGKPGETDVLLTPKALKQALRQRPDQRPPDATTPPEMEFEPINELLEEMEQEDIPERKEEKTRKS